MPLLYVHVPFCQRKCAYCAFFSQNDMSELKVREYLKALESEARIRQKDAPQGVSSLFIGGGTPTALAESELRRLLEIIEEMFSFQSSDSEKTIEANPGTLTSGKLKLLHNVGINRISLGVQTFNDHLLKEIGRIHSEEQVHESIRELREVGFNNLNLDLMFGLPGQTLGSWQESLEKALIYRPEHLSLYALMLEEGTPLAKRYAFNEKDEDTQAQMYELAVDLLKDSGYHQYETSNFSLPGYECRHNRGYWQGRDYIGLGPGAVSCLQGVRWQNIADITKYVNLLRSGQDPFEEKEILSERDRMLERIMLGLRMSEGINLKSFKEEFGVSFTDIYGKIMETYLSQGILELEQEFLKLNPKYTFIANSIIMNFVP